MTGNCCTMRMVSTRFMKILIMVSMLGHRVVVQLFLSQKRVCNEEELKPMHD